MISPKIALLAGGFGGNGREKGFVMDAGERKMPVNQP